MAKSIHIRKGTTSPSAGTRRALQREDDNSECGQGHGETGTLTHNVGMNINGVATLTGPQEVTPRITVWPSNPTPGNAVAVTFSEKLLSEKAYFHPDTRAQMFRATLFMIAKR